MLLARYSPALLGVVLLASGCFRKEKLDSCPGQCTVIAGNLVTSGQQPLAAAPVTAVWKSTYGYTSTVRARATTDARGNYQLSFYPSDEELQDGYFYVTYDVDKSQYLALFTEDGPDTSTGTGPGQLKRDTTYQLTPFLIPRKALVRLTVPNPDQIQQYFSVSFGSAYGRSVTPSKRSIGSGPAIGIPKQNTPFSYTAEVAADQKLYMQVSRSVNNVYTITTDSLVLPAGTTRAITVRY